MGKIVDIQGQIYLDSNGEEDNILFINPSFSSAKPLAELFQEELQKNGSNLVSVRYWISDKRTSKKNVKEDFTKKVLGFAEAQYNVAYSEITGYLWTDESLVIGGHDLLEELKSHADKFLFLELEIHEAATHEMGRQEGLKDAMTSIDNYVRDYENKAKFTNVEMSKRIFIGVVGVLKDLRADLNNISQKRR